MVTLGSTSREPINHPMPRDMPMQLQKLPLYGSLFKYPNIWNLDLCPDYNICASPVAPGTQLCFGDGGSPLYKMGCKYHSECLMGLASYSQMDSNEALFGRKYEKCNSGFFFTNMQYFALWIHETILRNS